MTTSISSPDTFATLNISPEIQIAIAKSGYHTPTAIQKLTIPPLLEGHDLLGQAQTGTGKTAAFAIPMLTLVDPSKREVQVLVLAPTRELAIQVAESFKTYGANIKGLKVLAVYGGQEYEAQNRPLKRGVHIVVGTPGRVMDHIRRGNLDLGTVRGLVLDEADEMLKMGFREDVEWILEKTPPHRQTSLFSATMPAPVRAIAGKYLKDMVEISTRTHTAAAETIGQRAYILRKTDRLDALIRILESEEVEAMLIFVASKMTTVELSEQIFRRGYSCVALNGDMAQNMREATVKRFKSGEVKFVVATEVAARGLDLRMVSHVVNYDVPDDPHMYVHRIGRTGRAGKPGTSILFVTTREKGFLQTVERETKQEIAVFPLPSTEDINDRRIARFKQKITSALQRGD
ncbi:DEAD/DEAH box helicase, partial [Myxococcota bacterium]|nr:DEAD/DEAH box helicase [Myxococcota bacterium]